jgi:hypothetical protein
MTTTTTTTTIEVGRRFVVFRLCRDDSKCLAATTAVKNDDGGETDGASNVAKEPKTELDVRHNTLVCQRLVFDRLSFVPLGFYRLPLFERSSMNAGRGCYCHCR